MVIMLLYWRWWWPWLWWWWRGRLAGGGGMGVGAAARRFPPYQRSLPGLLRDFAHRWPGVGRRASTESGVLRPTHDRPGVNDSKTHGLMCLLAPLLIERSVGSLGAKAPRPLASDRSFELAYRAAGRPHHADHAGNAGGGG